jgi:hypothetical protein
MRKAAGKDVGDIIEIQIDFDPKPRTTRYILNLKKHLKKIQQQKSHLKNFPHPAKKKF